MVERNDVVGVPGSVPRTVRGAGALVTAEGAVAVTVAVVLVVRALLGHREDAISGYGTAMWFGVLGGGVLASGIGLLFGQRWGRGIAVITQLLLLPVVWSLLFGSDQVPYGLLLGVVSVGALALLFAPATSRWAAQDYAPDPEE